MRESSIDTLVEPSKWRQAMRESSIDTLVDVDSDLPKDAYDHWSLVVLAIYATIQEAWEFIEDRVIDDARYYDTY